MRPVSLAFCFVAMMSSSAVARADDAEDVAAADQSDIGIGHDRRVDLAERGNDQRNLERCAVRPAVAGVQAGVFQMQSAQAVPASELKNKFLDLLRAQDKTFGYIVRGIANPNEIAVGGGQGGPFILDAVKVTLDGKEQSVRGLRFGAVTPAAFRDLAEASEERTLYSYRGGAVVAVSVIVPNLMFEELEIQRVTDVLQKPPIVPSPPRE
jgi:hypothetical protein